MIRFRSTGHLIDSVLGGIWDHPHKSGAPVELVRAWAMAVYEDNLSQITDYRVELLSGEMMNWRKPGVDGWRYAEAENRFLKGEYLSIEVRYKDGSAVIHQTVDGVPTLDPD